MITYDWNCKTVDVITKEGELTNVVYNVHYIVTGISDELDSQGNPYWATNIGTQLLNTSDITDFIPFDQITNEQVVEWTKSALGSDNVDIIEKNIESEINEKINPQTLTLTIEN